MKAPLIAFDPVRGYYLARWPRLSPQVRAAFRVFEVPAVPWHVRLLRWWVATPQGLFADFATGFIGVASLGVWALPIWLIFLLFLPAALMYRRSCP